MFRTGDPPQAASAIAVPPESSDRPLCGDVRS
jgi:hypothetical protein